VHINRLLYYLLSATVSSQLVVISSEINQLFPRLESISANFMKIRE